MPTGSYAFERMTSGDEKFRQTLSGIPQKRQDRLVWQKTDFPVPPLVGAEQYNYIKSKFV